MAENTKSVYTLFETEVIERLQAQIKAKETEFPSLSALIRHLVNEYEEKMSKKQDASLHE